MTSCGVGRLIHLITRCVILYIGVGDFLCLEHFIHYPLLPVYPGAPISQWRSSTKQQQHSVIKGRTVVVDKGQHLSCN